MAFSGPMLWTSGSHSLTVPFVVAGVILGFASRILDFALFGAREDIKAVEKGIAEIKDALAQRAGAAQSGPAESPTAVPPDTAFMPEPPEPQSPPPA